MVTLFLSVAIIIADGAAMSKTPPHNKFFTDGETVFLKKFTAVPDGSICRISETGTTLDGVILYVEPGSVTEPLKIEVSLNKGYIKLPDGIAYRNPIIQISMENNTKLNHPIKISIPATAGESGSSISCFFIKDDNSLSAILCTPAAMGEDKTMRFSMYTFHPGKFTWVVLP
jgi:hypothetical protein